MAWMLWVLDNVDVKLLVMSALKAGGGALAACVLKKVWSKVMPVTKKCMIDKCMGVAAQRGMCLQCYSKAKKKVDAGLVTWERLAEMGLCTRDGDDPFNDAYTRAMEDK